MDKLKNRIYSTLNVIRRRYSLLEVPRRGIHNAIAKAMSIFNNTPHSALKRHSLPQGAREQSSVGRSMIEMLGVLAIIAVLSVGGIAGYSKAMTKWRVNKVLQQITDIAVNTHIAYKQQKNFKGLNNQIAIKAGLIPQELIQSNNEIKDAFDDLIMIEDINGEYDTDGIGFTIMLQTYSKEKCSAIGNSNLINLNANVVISNSEDNIISDMLSYCKFETGTVFDYLCNGSNNTLPFPPKNVAEVCNKCSNNTPCIIFIVFK